MSTGSVSLSSGGESCIAYMRYTGADPFVIKEIIIIPGGSTGGSGNALIKIIKNPTDGTIIDNAVAFSAVNNRASLLISLELEGDTLTDGSNFAITTRDNFDEPVTFDAANIILKKGNSLGVCITPPAGNTAQTWVVAIVGFVETATVSGDLEK
jgi:hypothetical protein